MEDETQLLNNEEDQKKNLSELTGQESPDQNQNLDEQNPQEKAAARLKDIREKAQNPNVLTYEEFEKFAEIVKEFMVKTDLLKGVQNNLFFSMEVIKKDRDGFFEIVGFICNVHPEAIKKMPIVVVSDYMLVANEFLEGVRLLDFFTISTMILTRLITV